MKKVILVLAICLGVSVSLTSCKDKEHKHSEDTHMHDDVEKEVTKEKELASNTLYQCTMDCEKGKSYMKEGSCPVCKMDLKLKEVDMDSDSKHVEGDHDHDSNHSEGGRITKDAKAQSTPNN